MQGVLSRASFRRPPLSGQKTFTVLSLHVSNIYAKQRGIAKKLILTIRAIMIGQQIDVVAGDFNGTAWRCSNRDNISTIDEAFADCALPTPRGPTPLWGRGSIPNNWADVGTFSIPRRTLGLRPTDQSCHHGTWLHLDFVDWRSTQPHHDEHDRRISLKGRPTACLHRQQKRRITEVMSDHSLSSWTCNHLHVHVSFYMVRTSSRSDLKNPLLGTSTLWQLTPPRNARNVLFRRHPKTALTAVTLILTALTTTVTPQLTPLENRRTYWFTGTGHEIDWHPESQQNLLFWVLVGRDITSVQSYSFR